MTEQSQALVPTPNLAGISWSSGSMSNRRLWPGRRSRVRIGRWSDSACLWRMSDTLLTPWITIICNSEWRWRYTAGDVDQRGAYAATDVDVP